MMTFHIINNPPLEWLFMSHIYYPCYAPNLPLSTELTMGNESLFDVKGRCDAFDT